MLSHLKKTATVLVLGGLIASVSTAGTLIIEDGVDIPSPPVMPGVSSGVMPGVSSGAMPGVSSGAMPGGVAPAGTSGWTVREADGSILNVLLNWSAAAGWTFRLEHWTVDHDYPVEGGWKFESDFQSAVRALLDTTKQSQLPVQPCFYSNKVLRVLPRSELCDRGQAAQSPSFVSTK